jgi:hypothetical protein
MPQHETSLLDAPHDGQIYSRQNKKWVVSGGGPGGGIPEAPDDPFNIYGRSGAAAVGWQPALSTAGGTMTGLIALPVTPAPAQNSAVRRDYVDSMVNTAVALFMPRAGGTFTGSVTFQATSNFQLPAVLNYPMGVDDFAAINKNYLDERIAALPPSVPEAPPNTFAQGRIGALGTWTPVVPLSGGVSMTGPLFLQSATPIIDEQAAHKGYVDGLFTQTMPRSGGSFSGAVCVPLATIALNDQVPHKQYVDQSIAAAVATAQRSPPFLFNAPNNLTISGTGGWQQYYSTTYTLPRNTGSMVLVSVTITTTPVAGTQVGSIYVYGVRIQGGGQQRNVWCHFMAAGSEVANTVYFYGYSGLANTVVITVQISPVLYQATPFDFVVRGGDATVEQRTQVCIMDAGPFTPAADAVVDRE